MTIFTDGSAHPNPGPGGFGVIVLDNKTIIDIYSKQFTNNPVTNNEMELKAILYAFLKYGVKKDSFHYPIVYSDSVYAISTFENWMFNWARNGWRKSDKKAPENLELIKAYYEWYQKGYRIDLRKVKGHSDNLYNNYADLLATGKATPEQVKRMISDELYLGQIK